MIVFVGDIHGEFQLLPRILQNVPSDATVIQVGDFGIWPNEHKTIWGGVWEDLHLDNPILFIDGNHEYHPTFEDITEPTEVWEGAKYIPRGTIMTLEDKVFGFLGGASSVDVKYRTPGVSWFFNENATTEDARPLIEAPRLDVMVTHTPPQSLIRERFPHPSVAMPYFNLPGDWVDYTAVLVQEIWDAHDHQPEIFCGHFHTSMIGGYPGSGRIRILDINEVYQYRRNDA